MVTELDCAVYTEEGSAELGNGSGKVDGAKSCGGGIVSWKHRIWQSENEMNALTIRE